MLYVCCFMKCMFFLNCDESIWIVEISIGGLYIDFLIIDLKWFVFVM